MSGFIDAMNSAGEAFVLFAVRMLIQSSVLILILLLLDLVLRKRVRAVVRYWIWLLVLAKLLLPPSLSSPTSLAWWLGDRLPETSVALVGAAAEPEREIPVSSMPQTTLSEVAVTQTSLDPVTSPAATVPLNTNDIPAPAAAAPTWQALVLAAWLIVVAVMFVLLAQRALFVRRLVLQSQDAPERLRDLLDRCRRQMRVRTPLRLRLTCISASPSVCGLVRPTILVPQRMLTHLDSGQLRSILLHELAHVRRADLWVNLAQTLLQIAYVYHPLVWLANAIIRKVREQAVDETVLAAMGDEAEDYPRTLLTISKLAFGQPSLTLRLIGVVESKRTLTARIRHIAGRPFPTSAKLGLLGLVFVFAVAMALLPMAGRTQVSAATTPDEQETSTPFKATLSNGPTVEVLGIREFPGDGTSWWRPDGAPVTGEKFPEFRTTDPDYTDANARVRLLVIRLDGPTLDGVSLSHHLTRARKSSFHPRYQDDQRKVLQPIQTFIARFPDDAATTDLKIGIAAGTWKDAAAGSEGHTTTYTKDNITQSEVIYHPVQQNGSLHITATHLLGRDYDCRIVAEDEAHNVFEPARYSNTGGQMRLCSSVLDVPLAQVKWFRLQARPYEWVEFKDIRLMPESQEAKAAMGPAFGGSPATHAPTGVVVDEQGIAVPRARVVLYYKKSNQGLGNRIVEEARTDAQGRFALAGPLTFESSNGTDYTDHYLLLATHPDHALAWQVIVGNSQKDDYRLTMTEPGRQGFHVADREGNPLVRARVWIYGAGRDDDPNPLLRPSCNIPEDIGLLTATTDEQGRATLGNLPRTSCSFKASMPGYSNRFIFGGVPSQGETRVEMTRAGIATGHVLTTDGKPVAGAQIVFQADWGEWYFEYATTDETGRFLNDTMVARGGSWVDGGGSGQYKVAIRHPDFTAQEFTIQLEPGKTDAFDIEAVEGTLLRVRALEPETERAIAGARIGGSSAGGRLGGYTDANGVLERRVLNGNASAFFYSPPGGTYVIKDLGSTVRVLAKGGIENVTVYAPTRLYPLVDIKGRLLLPDGSAAAGLRISTLNASRYHTTSFGGSGGAYTRTNPDGSFELKEVPRDLEVFLYAETSDHTYVLAEVLEPTEASPELARPLIMKAGGTASLLLTDKSGKPRANMSLKLRPRKWENYVFRADDRPAMTDAEGRLTLDGIVPGLEYFIRDARADLSERGWWDLYNENRVLLPADSSPVVPAAALPVSAGDGTILSGLVADSQGKPVESAEVALYEALPGELGVLPDIERIDNKTTGADGAFSFTAAKNNRAYREGYVVVRKSGFSVAWAPWPMHEDHRLNVTLGQPMELAGEVVDEAGRPVAEAEVHIAMAKIGKGESLRELRAAGFFQTRTDGNGRFVFADMPAGATFEFLVTGPGRATVGTVDLSSFSREQCRFAPGQEGIRLTLPEGARIEGVVVEKTGGKPLAGVQLRAHPDRRGSGAPIPSKHVVTTQDGAFRIDGLSPGTCVVELWTPRDQKPEWVAADMRTSLRAGETKSGLRMELTQGAIIEAFIRNPAGKPVEKVNAHFELIGQTQGFGERTDANGLARIRVIPGSYRVSQIYRPGYTPPETTDQVTIEEGQTKRMEFTVIPAPKVAGIVRDQAGNPLAGVKVQVVWIKMLSSLMSETTSDASGGFEIEWGGSPMTQSPTAVILVARDSARNLAHAMDIDEHTGPLDIKLKPGVIVTGMVLDPDGKPLPGANARVLLRASRATVRLGWRELATTDPSGAFEARGFPMGQEYTVEVSAEGYGKKEIPVDSLDPKVTHHDIGPVKLALSNLTVSGVVVDPNDEPVTDVEVSPFGQGQPDLRSVRTDAQGRFTITGVSPGPVHLIVNPRGQSRLSGNAEAEGGATDVKITLFERPSAPVRSISLKGKPLPPLEDLGIDVPTEAKGRMLLVCFWDMNQRPSRNTVTQLAERTKELADKGIVIVAVQSSRADQARLNKWIDQNKIPFPVGRIQGDVNKTRLVWGVRSLPWLILNDRDHIVRAEGFDLGELQSTMEAIALVPAAGTGSEPAKTGPGELRGAASERNRRASLPPGATPGPLTEWPASKGGNSHFYQAVAMGRPVTWTDANDLARSLGGHLVTLTSRAETDFVFELIDETKYWYRGINWRGPWIGAYQPAAASEPAGDWRWITGEPFDYHNWDAGQPNNYGGLENYAAFGNQQRHVRTWNDFREDFPEIVSFVVEFSNPAAARGQ